MRFETTTKLFYGKFPYKAVIEHHGFDTDLYYNNMRTIIKKWYNKIF